MGKYRRKEKDVVSIPQETKRYLNPEMLQSSAPEYELREVVLLPEGVSYNEWLASHCLAFFDHINLVYGTISEFCTISGCPDMIGPGSRLYLWVDEKGKRCRLSAPQYVDYVMTYTQKIVNDESIFPTKFDKEFPTGFEGIVKKVLLLLFHVLAHIYHSHFREIESLNLHSQMNCIFAHFMLFNYQFLLIDEKESEVLQDLAVGLSLIPPSDNSNHSTACSSQKLENPGELATGDEKEEEVITTQCRSISPFISGLDTFKTPDCSMPNMKSDQVPLSQSRSLKIGATDYNHLTRRCSSTSAIVSSEPPTKSKRRSNSNATEKEYYLVHPEPLFVDPLLFASSSLATGASREYH